MDSPARSRRPGCCVPSHSSSGVQGGTATASGWGERGRGLAGHRYHRERELAALRKGWRAPARLLSRQTREARGRGALPTNSVLISLTSNHHPSHCVTKRRQQRLKLLFFYAIVILRGSCNLTIEHPKVHGFPRETPFGLAVAGGPSSKCHPQTHIPRGQGSQPVSRPLLRGPSSASARLIYEDGVVSRFNMHAFRVICILPPNLRLHLGLKRQ